MLAKEKTELGDVFLDMAHVVQLQLHIAHRMLCIPIPGEGVGPLGLLLCQLGRAPRAF